MKVRGMILVMLVCCAACVAQTRRVSSSAIVRAYEDSLAQARERVDTLMAAWERERAAAGAAADAADGRYMRLFVPLTYYPELMGRYFKTGDDERLMRNDGLLIDKALMGVYVGRPELVKRYGGEELSFDDELLLTGGKVDVTPLEETLDAPQAAEQDFEAIDLVIKTPNFWTFSGDFFLQAMQTYYSKNWYQGLESNYSWFTKVTLQANYNNKQKVTWDNKLEMNIGFQTNRSDEVHKLQPSEDLLRYTGKVGLQATKRWYYTFQVIANTQFMNSYESNTDNLTSAFFSPLNVNLSIGMSYNANFFGGKLTGSAYLSPVALNYKFVKHSELAETNGIDAGKHAKWDFGSTFTVEGVWKFNDIISWTTRLYGYTPYDRIELQWENTFDIHVTKIIAVSLYAYPRFDDSSKELKSHGFGYFQLKEYVSFGLTYSF